MSERLPPAAEARIAELRSSGTWGSTLTTDEFAAIRSVGFEPVGQVFGAAVYSAGSASRYTCPRGGSAGDGRPTQPAAQVSGRGGSFGPLVQTMELARRTAVGRMTTECAELGGHGVVGVRLTRGSFPVGGPQFTAIGTAVRGRGAMPGQPAPFTAEVSGQDFAKLMITGWVPVGLVFGISIGSRHDDRTTTRQARWGSGNAEVAGWTELVSQSRDDARRQLETDVQRLGADGVVIATMEMQARERDCPEATGRRDHIVETTLIGTAIAGFARAGPPRDRPALAVMSLDPQRRQAARIRI